MKRNTTHRGQLTTTLAATTLLFACLAPPVHAGATLEQPETTVYRTAPLIDQPQDEVWDVLNYRDVTVQVKITEEDISATKYAKIHLQTSNTKSGQDWQTMETLTYTEGTDSAPVLYHKLLNVEHSTAALGQYLRWQVEFEDATTSQWVAFKATLAVRLPSQVPGEKAVARHTVIETMYPLPHPPSWAPDASWVGGPPASWVPPRGLHVNFYLPKLWEHRIDIPTIMWIHGRGDWINGIKQEQAAFYGSLMNAEGIAVVFPEYRQDGGLRFAPYDFAACVKFLREGDHGVPFGDLGIMASSLGNAAYTRWEIMEEAPMPALKGYCSLSGFFAMKRKIKHTLLTNNYMKRLEGWPILMQVHEDDIGHGFLKDYVIDYSHAIDLNRPDIHNTLKVYSGDVERPHTFFWDTSPVARQAQQDQVDWWNLVLLNRRNEVPVQELYTPH